MLCNAGVLQSENGLKPTLATNFPSDRAIWRGSKYGVTSHPSCVRRRTTRDMSVAVSRDSEASVCASICAAAITGNTGGVAQLVMDLTLAATAFFVSPH